MAVFFDIRVEDVILAVIDLELSQHPTSLRNQLPMLGRAILFHRLILLLIIVMRVRPLRDIVRKLRYAGKVRMVGLPLLGHGVCAAVGYPHHPVTQLGSAAGWSGGVLVRLVCLPQLLEICMLQSLSSRHTCVLRITYELYDNILAFN